MEDKQGKKDSERQKDTERQAYVFLLRELENVREMVQA